MTPSASSSSRRLFLVFTTTLLLLSVSTAGVSSSASYPTSTQAKQSFTALLGRLIKVLQQPAVKKRPYAALLQSKEIFMQSAACGDKEPATKEEMMREMTGFRDAMQWRLARYSLAAAAIKWVIDKAEEADADFSGLACYTFLIPQNTAITNTLPKVATDLKTLAVIFLYNMWNGTYAARKLRRMQRRSDIPTIIPGYPVQRHWTFWGPLDLVTFGGSLIGIGRPGSLRPTWAELEDPNIYAGKYLVAHGVTTWVKPDINWTDFQNGR
eukprot:TRINITY_DN32875_c1_g1_i1.p1 TRINITY_DN32875_c1_g1~~TRINITY_DN32875_c1_g1_i1.p1  ORF type:complete len:268 (-),score=14.32 TRINITY_DN32875_c1_g1_i1:479-1282(-)